ncbi:MAG: UDP-glucose 4-epimerase (EC [uncultured Thiotrichaceae bacterium]|uniref:UDP-glucose 4-epimerase n=1 Tax=uncultured Thiotrichaceae bacterium TaxID=298394 RepID=A0A6S6TXY3_9GAMM|nr:MAG: UDP-glucose 4-epimerase (EC [uncultured Thiotrichaceae bacterium]
MKNILVTGGAGYIGSHTCVELIETGDYCPIVLDNLCNSSAVSLDRVKQITGQDVAFVEGDIRDAELLDKIFADNDIYAVIHFAGLKAVGESVEKPMMYYENNIAGSINLFAAMKRNNVKRVVFSSSATVYGDPASVPIKEGFPLSATNAYGRSKLFIEEILRDVNYADNEWDVALLRYFNPVGAHKSGLIGEDPSGIPNNLMPYIARVAVGTYDALSVFGSDYPTRDGTGVRDYIHVVDLAKGHVKALDAFDREDDKRLFTVNLGTGQGYSVLDMVKAFENASGNKVAYNLVDRREGDVAECFADPALAKSFLGWETERGIDEMCQDTWRWQSENPKGFAE